MKKILIVLLALIGNISHAQEHKVIDNDSLLKLFQTRKPFEVLEKVQFEWFNFKTSYNDTLLKIYLMKWLNRDEYFQYTIDKERETIKNRPDLIKDEIQYIINKQGRGKAIDSILTNPTLYIQYRDSAISAYVNRYIKGRDGAKIPIPDKAIVLHSYFAYPDSYTILKKWWGESGGTINRGLFLSLVRMGDPEARKLFDNRVTQLVKTNGEIPGIMYIDGELNELRNSYSVAKLIDLLKVNLIYNPLGDDPQPYNCFVINYLLNDFYAHSIDVGKIKTSDPCDVLKKHLPEIKVAAQKLIEIYKAEEYYWMKNMPFYKEQ